MIDARPVAYVIRPGHADDRVAIESMYPVVFPDEDLLPLVQDLLNHPRMAVSFVAVVDEQIVGHAAFTFCQVAGFPDPIVLLGPLAVAPDQQQQGIGTALVSAGEVALQKQGVKRAFVLGDPDYYSRLGFSADDQVEPPYPLPPEWAGAWQSKVLTETAVSCSGRLSVPEFWRKPDLWGH